MSRGRPWEERFPAQAQEIIDLLRTGAADGTEIRKTYRISTGALARLRKINGVAGCYRKPKAAAIAGDPVSELKALEADIAENVARWHFWLRTGGAAKLREFIDQHLSKHKTGGANGPN